MSGVKDFSQISTSGYFPTVNHILNHATYGEHLKHNLLEDASAHRCVVKSGWTSGRVGEYYVGMSFAKASCTNHVHNDARFMHHSVTWGTYRRALNCFLFRDIIETDKAACTKKYTSDHPKRDRV